MQKLTKIFHTLLVSQYNDLPNQENNQYTELFITWTAALYVGHRRIGEKTFISVVYTLLSNHKETLFAKRVGMKD